MMMRNTKAVAEQRMIRLAFPDAVPREKSLLTLRFCCRVKSIIPSCVHHVAY